MFEGDAPADLARNSLLRERLGAAVWPESPRSAPAWLGDAVSIKEPTSALFRRQGGNHLLIVGQNEECGSLGVSVSVAHRPGGPVFPRRASGHVRQGARFYVLDGTPEDRPSTGALARVAAALPHRVEVGGWPSLMPIESWDRRRSD